MTFQANQFPRLRNLSNPLPNSCSIRRKGKLVRNESGNTPNELSQGAKKAARKLLLLLLLLLVARARRIYIYISTYTHPTYTSTYRCISAIAMQALATCHPTREQRPLDLPSPLPSPARAHFHNRRPPSSTPPVHPRYRTKKEGEKRKKKKPRVPSVSESGRIRSIIPERRRRRGGASFTPPAAHRNQPRRIRVSRFPDATTIMQRMG